MLKKERFLKILSELDKNDIVTVNDLTTLLNCSDMTIRRDLEELSESGKLIRIHGGAQKVSVSPLEEASHVEKRQVHIKEKQEIAKLAANQIENFDTIFIGPGTTLELIAQNITKDINSLRVVTISIPVFESFKNSDLNCELILAGGIYRSRSGTLIGALASNAVSGLKFDKAFVGVNGIQNSQIMTANTEEGRIQSVALNNSQTKYIVTDKYKLNRNDFYTFYSLDDVDYLVTNKSTSKETIDYYQQYVRLITK
ncbi:DeoR/GlpR family DNA-binding transcription regulator [Companilactobacillus nantensis]|uniref:Lactose phosphotransferase system repressor n=1 Tax=Companilactobacillus nantensis DSM 16982 TaxID=1423774 RepID=A0A0R1WHV6_9LACO|nr:DeoR/GlpR family DNA-binding transcription regulator [Companilactobacillus nantensis]KRM17538.1 lactose phosphotransferase system repressor [Companilactobacillus nantensis DSM 16982]GEO64856.1 DeoR family transcriptional regulator [Companilactobacillus nantensis]